MLPVFRAPAKIVEVSRGEFTCPKCGCLRRYRHKEKMKRVIVVFVPILTDKLDEYVQCDTCKDRFPLTALRTELAASTAQMVGGLKEKLVAGMAIEDAESLLANANVEIGMMKQYISVAAGIGRKRCPECNLTYRKNVLNCRKCSHVLPAAPSIVSGV